MERDATLPFVADDGGRAAAGFKGHTGDCAVRAIAIATGMPYADAYALVGQFCAKERPSKRRRGTSHPRKGVHAVTMRAIMASLGWEWVPTMGIGTGCRVHLKPGELPGGRIICRVSKHYAAVLDGVLHDTHDCARPTHWVRSGGGGAGGPDELLPGEWRNSNGYCSVQYRCVYGFWREPRP